MVTHSETLKHDLGPHIWRYTCSYEFSHSHSSALSFFQNAEDIRIFHETSKLSVTLTIKLRLEKTGIEPATTNLQGE